MSAGFPRRKHPRLDGYDYSLPGAYFVTVNVAGERCLLSEIRVGRGLAPAEVRLSGLGRIVEEELLALPRRYPGVAVERYVIMPNHIHLILLVDDTAAGGTSKAPSPTNAVTPHFVSTLKRFCHRDAGKEIFQRSYHDHVIRDEEDYLKIWKYIDNNPARWQEDCFYAEQSSQAAEGAALYNIPTEETL